MVTSTVSLEYPAPLPRKISCAVFLVTFLIAIAFAAYTKHAWEDYYITYRVSKNLATGHGLVFTPGQRVHAFTSPLGVLIPAGLSALAGPSSDAMVLWIFRIISAVALAAAAVLLLQVARRLSLSWLPMAFLMGMFALDAKIIDFTINGMETGLLLFFLALTLHALLAPGPLPVLQLGISWAGLMWTRPDSFIYIGGLALAAFIFFPQKGHSGTRTTLVWSLVTGGLIAAVLYLPWIAWAWNYYGSPIPNTVIAKGLNKPYLTADLLPSLLLYPFLSLLYKGSMAAAFLPPYAVGGWPDWLTLWSRALAWPSAVAWVVPGLARPIRAVSLALMIGFFYLDEISPFPYPWYLPTCTVLSIFVLAGILQNVSAWFENVYREKTGFFTSKVVFSSVVALSLAMTLALTCLAAYQLRVQQKLIEEGTRKQVGLWLAENARSQSDTVFLEPLGYIAFYSQLKMLDFPGLSSPEVIAARKKLGSDRAAGLIAELRPDWLVLRAAEAQRIGAGSPELLTKTYQPVKTFDVSEAVRSYRWLPGRDYLEVDQSYTIFERMN